MVENTFTAGHGGEGGVPGQGGSVAQHEENVTWAYICKLLSGKIRQVVQRSTNQEGGEVFGPHNACTKIFLLIQELLQEKHPPIQ